MNFRVSNLEAMVAQLRAAGVAVTIDPETYPMAALRGSAIRRATPSSSGNPAGRASRALTDTA